MRCERLQRVLLAATALVACAAAGAQSTFRITSIFSNLDGSVQFVRLTETAGLNGQHRFAGLQLTATHRDVTKVYTFEHDLPSEITAHASILVAAGPVPLTDYLGNYAAEAVADFAIPHRFVPTEAGAIDFAGTDRVAYASLPTDGWHVLLRDGTVAAARLPASACPPYVALNCHVGGGPSVAQTLPRAIEYYHATHDHYFITASAPDIDALDSGRIAGWQRTGTAFAVGGSTPVSIHWNFWDVIQPPPYPMRPVCRYYLPPASGDSHFYSISAAECDEVRQRYPTFVFETGAAFYAALPDVHTGACAQGEGFLLAPMFRLWNGRADTNHRYTLSAIVRDFLIGDGWIPEGYGDSGVAFCVPLGV